MNAFSGGSPKLSQSSSSKIGNNRNNVQPKVTAAWFAFLIWDTYGVRRFFVVYFVGDSVAPGTNDRPRSGRAKSVGIATHPDFVSVFYIFI